MLGYRLREQLRLSKDIVPSALVSTIPEKHTHIEGGLECGKSGEAGGRQEQRVEGQVQPYRGFRPISLRQASQSRAGSVWLTVVQY